MDKTDVAKALAVPLTWGIGLVLSKAVIGGFPPILLMGFRFSIAALILVWFAPIPWHRMWALIGITLVAATIQYSLTFTGLLHLEAGVAGLIVQLEVPLLVLLGAVVLGERVGPRKWLGIALAFSGVALIAGRASLQGQWIPALMVVGGALSWAVGQVLIRRLDGVDGRTVTAWIAVLAAPQLFLASALLETGQAEAVRNADWTVWATVLYLGAIMTAFAYFLWYSLIRKHGVSPVAPYLLLLPVFVVAGGVLFLGEDLAPAKILGGIIVIAGVALVSLEPGRFSRRKAPLPAP